jgi:predicted RNA binding protein YcfA (HicA-like mRNA interferase family)
MTQRKKLQSLLRDAYRKPIAFRDFEKLLKAYGFTHARTTGSHRQYTHPKVPRAFPVQPEGKDAKRYQVRELLALIDQYDLHMEA